MLMFEKYKECSLDEGASQKNIKKAQSQRCYVKGSKKLKARGQAQTIEIGTKFLEGQKDLRRDEPSKMVLF